MRWSFDDVAVEEGQAGANQVWDVSGYNGTELLLRRIINPSETEHSATFPTATHCQRDSFGNGTYTDYYHSLGDGQYVLLGNVTITLEHEDPGIVELDPIALTMPVPLTFGTSSWTSVSQFGFELFPGTDFTFRDSSIYVVDGWGSIETDNGTYQVLRVFGQGWYISTTTGEPPVTRTGSSYNWIDMHGNTICSMYSEGLDPNIQLAAVYVADVVQFVDVPHNPPVAVSFSLSQNYPNPFNSSTQIQYYLPQLSNVNLKVFDILGREVATLVNGDMQSIGSHVVNWNGRNSSGVSLASGTYVYRIEAGQFRDEKKMMLVK